MKTYKQKLENILLDFGMPKFDCLSLIDDLSEKQSKDLVILFQKVMIRVSIKEMLKTNV